MSRERRRTPGKSMNTSAIDSATRDRNARAVRGRNQNSARTPVQARSKSDCFDFGQEVPYQQFKENRNRQLNNSESANNSHATAKLSHSTPTRKNNRNNSVSFQQADPFRFEEYLAVTEAEDQVVRNQLLYGVLRVSTAHYEEAFIPSLANDADVLIYGIAARNRALNGDCVAVRIEPIRNWKAMRVPEDLREALKKRFPNRTGESFSRNGERPWFSVGEVYEVDEQVVRDWFDLTEREDVNIRDLLDSNVFDRVDYELIQRTGNVVSILNAVAPRVLVGLLRIPDMYRQLFVHAITFASARRNDAPDFRSVERGSYAVLSPRDSRAPRIRISLLSIFDMLKYDTCAHLRESIVTDNQTTTAKSQDAAQDNFESLLYYARITEWPIDSAMPLGTLVRVLGPLDNVAVRNEAILLENGVDYCEQYDEETLASLQKFFAASKLTEPAHLNDAKCTRPKSKGKTNAVLEQFSAANTSASVLSSSPITSSAEPGAEQLEVHISNEDLQARRDFDFRNEPALCTIDPETARDLDDAVHCRLLNDQAGSSLFEVGVHIADVSHFVQEQSNLDEEARRRATTVYLAERAIHMLPDALSQQLASLAPGHDRLTFSVIWKISLKVGEDGSHSVEIVDERFGKSVINSCAQLSYEDAQALLSDDSTPERIERARKKLKHGDLDTIRQSLRQLNRITKALNAKRLQDGSLRIENPKLMFRVDSETGLPTECSVYPRVDSHRLIEELMLLANNSVAKKLYQDTPARAFLRRHPKPTFRQLSNLASQCAQFGFLLGASISANSSSADLQSALNGLETALRRNAGIDITASGSQTTAEDSGAIFRIFLNVCSKVLPLAVYYCVGYQDPSIWSSDHYALAMQKYCHFTSPIRRYADIVVHRQLAAVLDERREQSADVLKPTLRWLKQEMTAIVALQRQAELCNARKRAARDVQEGQTTLYLGVFIKQRTPMCNETCYVMALFDMSIDLYIIRFGIIKRCYKDQQDGLLKWIYKRVDSNQSKANCLTDDVKTVGDTSADVSEHFAQLRVSDDTSSGSEAPSDAESDADATDLNATTITTSNHSRPPMEVTLIWRSAECTLHRNSSANEGTQNATAQDPSSNKNGEACKCTHQSIRLLQPIKCTFVNRMLAEQKQQQSKSKKKKQKQQKSNTEKERDPFEWTVKIEHS